MTTYREAVAEARRLAKRSEEDQWRLAELTWTHAEPQQGARTSRVGVKSLTSWAADVGISQQHAGRIRQVWIKFKDVDERPRFADAYASISMPLDRAERREAEAMSNIRKAPPERKAAIARELLREPEVATAVATDPAASRALNEAAARTDLGKAIAHNVKARAAQLDETGPGPFTPMGMLQLWLRHAGELREAAEEITVRGVTSEAMPMVQALSEHLAATAAILAAVVGTPVKVTDENIEAWLRGEVA